MEREVMMLVSLTHNFRLLRQLELQEARRYVGMHDRCTDPEAKEFLRRRIANIVGDARKWSRALVKAKRDLRRHMLDRRLVRFVQQVPRDKWVPVGAVVSLSGGNIR